MWAVQKQVVGQLWPMDHGLPIPDLEPPQNWK